IQRRDRSVWAVIAGLILLMLVGGAVVYLRPATPAVAVVEPQAAPTLPDAGPKSPSVAQDGRAEPERRKASSEPAAPSLPSPSFDIVRVTPEGGAVVAGRAEPGAEVILRDGEHTVGSAKADRNGEFVIVPAEHLPPGGRELTLAARGADGWERLGSDSVVVIVPRQQPATDPAAETSPKQAVAVLVPPGDAPARLLQAPGKKEELALNTVDYDEHGEIRFSGSAKPSAPVRVYVDNKAAGETSSDGTGQWTLTPPASVVPGLHQLRVDELASSGRVMGRVELPFQRTGMAETARPGQTIVQPGQNLWRIARQSYGQGTRYTVIYLANRAQIRDPKLIYPGQVFAMPASE
ncbi:MAG: Ig-like domain-containing protein, partial [Pseudomonadota bacterium]|nr:Ig-like domain-containing protein [Pseudomonadota bacterium]